MTLLAAKSISVHFGPVTVFEGISCQLEPGERVGLVGRNGAGKTTLLRCLAGELDPDKGDVARQRELKVGYLPQRPEPPKGVSVLRWVLDVFGDVVAIEEKLERVHDELAKAEGEALEKLLAREARLREELEQHGGYNLEQRAESVLSALGVPGSKFHAEATVLSGGERSRCALARALVREPDVLLLDEPTNHLDLGAVEWLEDRLAVGAEALVVVSHDRWFLDRLTTSIWEMRRERLAAFPGNWTDYRMARDAADEKAAADKAKFDRFLRKEEDFIRRNIAGQKTRMAKSRRKRLAKIRDEGGVPEGPVTDGKGVALRFDNVTRTGEVALHARGIHAGYEGLPDLVVRAELEVRRGDRVGIVGPNGCGKTTFLRVLTGELPPRKGDVKLGANVKLGYYRQEGEDLPKGKSAVDAAHDAKPTATLQEIRDLLGAFGLTGDRQETVCGALSGGERARVSLARVILASPNVLVLDEPTNHLDADAREALEDALVAFPGSVLMVSHDRYFLSEVATKILSFESPGAPPRQFSGDYADYREKRDQEEREAKAALEAKRALDRERERAKEKAPPPKKGPAKKKRRTLEECEARMIELEEARKKLHEALASEAIYKDVGKLRETQAELERVEAELREVEVEWEAYASEG